MTGGTGLLGNTLIRLLLSRGESVRVLVRAGSDPRPLEGLRVDAVEGDLTEASPVGRAVRGCRGVFHAGALVRVGRTGYNALHAVNAEGTRNVARAALGAGVRMLHVSTVDVLRWGTREEPGDEETLGDTHMDIPYIRSKWLAERVISEEVDRGLDAVTVNPAYLLGPWDWKPGSGRMLLAVGRGLGLVAPPGGNDFCHAGAVAEGVLLAFERGRSGRRYVLGGEALTYREAWTLFAGITGGRRPMMTAPAWATRVAGWAAGVRGAARGHEGDLNRATALVSTLPHHFTSRRAVAELGYRPRPAREAAQEAWDWFRAEGYAR